MSENKWSHHRLSSEDQSTDPNRSSSSGPTGSRTSNVRGSQGEYGAAGYRVCPEQGNEFIKT